MDSSRRWVALSPVRSPAYSPTTTPSRIGIKSPAVDENPLREPTVTLARTRQPSGPAPFGACAVEDDATSANVSLRQLRYFVVLAHELNYRRAAERLFITQPALSTAIKQLESLVGVPLFTRTTREVALTEVGAAWLPTLRDAMAGVDAAMASLESLAGVGQRTVRMGYLIGTGADLVFRLMREIEAAYPDIVIEPTEFDFSAPTAGLADGTTELALIRPPVDLVGHRMLILESEDWVACLPRDHRLAGREQVQIAELLNDPIVAAPESAGTWRDYWLGMDARGGRPPTIAAVAATYEAETTLVARGIGISFTTQASARLYSRPGVVYVPIEDRPTSYTALAWSPATLSLGGELVVRYLREHWSAGDGEQL